MNTRSAHNRDHKASFDTPLNWDSWVRQPILTARQATMLMVGVDPAIPKRLMAADFVSKLIRLAKHMEFQALKQAMRTATYREWAEWANSQEMVVHPIFAIKALETIR